MGTGMAGTNDFTTQGGEIGPENVDSLGGDIARLARYRAGKPLVELRP